MAAIEPQVEGGTCRAGVDGGVAFRAVAPVEFLVDPVLDGKLSVDGAVLLAGVAAVGVSGFWAKKKRISHGPNNFHRNYVLKSMISAAERLRIDFSVGHVALADSLM